MNFTPHISVTPVAASFAIEGVVADFDILPPSNQLSEFENDYTWSNLQKGFDKVIEDPTILLDKYIPHEDKCQTLSDCKWNNKYCIGRLLQPHFTYSTGGDI